MSDEAGSNLDPRALEDARDIKPSNIMVNVEEGSLVVEAAISCQPAGGGRAIDEAGGRLVSGGLWRVGKFLRARAAAIVCILNLRGENRVSRPPSVSSNAWLRS